MSNVLLFYKKSMIFYLKMAIYGTLVRDKSVNNNKSSNGYSHN